MPSFDRPRGGGDKPPVPKPPIVHEPQARESEQVGPPAARNRSSYERGAAEHNTRSADEDVNGQDQDSPSGQASRRREGTAAAGHGGETVTRTDKNADRFQALFDSQGQLIDAYKERAAILQGDVTALRNQNEKLENRNDTLQEGLERKDQTIRQKDQTIDRLTRQIDQLKSQVRELEGGSSVDKAPNVVSHEGKTEARPAAEKSWLRRAAEKLPGKDTLAFGGAGATLAEVVAVNSHHLTDPQKATIVAVTGLGGAGYTLVKKQIDKHISKDKDKDGKDAG